MTTQDHYTYRTDMAVACHRTLSDDDCRDWVGFLNASAHQHPRQDPAFGPVETMLGRQVIHAIGRRAGRVCAVGLFSLVPHPVLSGAFTDAFCLSGPVADTEDDLLDFATALAKDPAFARVGRLRLTPFWRDRAGESLGTRLRAAGWRITDREPVRPTGFVDLAPDMEEILGKFSKSARREIRRAERQGVELLQIADLDQAGTFFDSLSRLRHQRRLPSRDKACFLANFPMIHAPGQLGVLICAYHQGDFLAGLLLYRGRDVAHARHFTTEPERLHALSNLRIAPLVWLAAMRWAKGQGCSALDVCGYEVQPLQTGRLYNINKYKGEFAPIPIARLAEHGRVIAPFIHVTGNAKALVKVGIKRILGRH